MNNDFGVFKIIDDIFYDFKGFFIDENSASFVKYETKGFDLKTVGVSEKARIVIPCTFSDLEYREEYPANSIKIYVLFLISHELAHLINKHNSHEDDEQDYKILECWADFFGAKIAMCILKYGNNFIKNLWGDFSNPNFGLAEILKALVLLKSIYDNESSKYPSANERMFNTISGVIAFLVRSNIALDSPIDDFDKRYGTLQIEWSKKVFFMMQEMGISDKIFSADMKPCNIEAIKKQAEKISKIHFALQEKEKGVLINGLHFPVNYIIGAPYLKTIQPNKYSLEYLLDRQNNK